jgi:L-rhamnose mutarotase
MSEAKSIFIYFYASSPDAAAWMYMNRSEVSSKWNKCRIYVGDQLDRWNELKEVLRVQTRAKVAKILLDR